MVTEWESVTSRFARYWNGFVEKLQSAAMADAIPDSLVVWFVNPEKKAYIVIYVLKYFATLQV